MTLHLCTLGFISQDNFKFIVNELGLTHLYFILTIKVSLVFLITFTFRLNKYN